jgi:hypothetical protein
MKKRRSKRRKNTGNIYPIKINLTLVFTTSVAIAATNIEPKDLLCSDFNVNTLKDLLYKQYIIPDILVKI